MVDTKLYNKEGKKQSLADVINNLILPYVNRVEVIDQKGRSYVNYKDKNVVSIQMQDEERTLKIFID